MKQITVRVEDDVAARIDQLVQQVALLQSRNDLYWGITYTRSQLVRSLIGHGLRAIVDRSQHGAGHLAWEGLAESVRRRKERGQR